MYTCGMGGEKQLCTTTWTPAHTGEGYPGAAPERHHQRAPHQGAAPAAGRCGLLITCIHATHNTHACAHTDMLHVHMPPTNKHTPPPPPATYGQSLVEDNEGISPTCPFTHHRLYALPLPTPSCTLLQPCPKRWPPSCRLRTRGAAHHHIPRHPTRPSQTNTHPKRTP